MWSIVKAVLSFGLIIMYILIKEQNGDEGLIPSTTGDYRRLIAFGLLNIDTVLNWFKQEETKPVLVNCKTCGYSISNEALSCPKCGGTGQGTEDSLNFIGSVLLFIAVLWVVMKFIYHKNIFEELFRAFQ